MDYFDLDLVAVADDVATRVAGVDSVRLFGSRKYEGKVRSDLDLLITGPRSNDVLLEFRSSQPQYEPLDLWLAMGDFAVSAVTGSTLPIASLRTIELYPAPDGELLGPIRTQRFRADIEYKMSVVPPSIASSPQRDALGIRDFRPSLLDPSLIIAGEAVVEVLDGAVRALVRMRGDGNARRGKGTQLSLLTEYDFQNLAEVSLAPFIPLQREAFVVRSSGKERTVDFSLAGGRLALELKFAKTSSELNSELKDAQGVLAMYLEHPGVELALAVIAVAEGVKFDYNATRSWHIAASFGRRALVRTITIPSVLSQP